VEQSKDTTTEREQKILSKIAQFIISASVTLEFMEEVKLTPVYRKKIKQTGNRFLSELSKIQNDYYEKLLNASEEGTDNLFDTQYDVVKSLSKLNIYKFDEIRQVIEAYEKEPKAIQGIVYQINKRN